MFKDNLLKNKTIVVTGGGSGLGKSMARRFGELGANLVISGRRKEVLEEAAHEFSEKNIDVLTCPGDVRKIEDVEKTCASGCKVNLLWRDLNAECYFQKNVVKYI